MLMSFITNLKYKKALEQYKHYHYHMDNIILLHL